MARQNGTRHIHARIGPPILFRLYLIVARLTVEYAYGPVLGELQLKGV